VDYDATTESLRRHVVPEWFHDAKLGVMVHWGLYSVPAWAPLAGEAAEVVAKGGWGNWFTNNPGAEWYANSIRLTNSPACGHHLDTYGRGQLYAGFAPRFHEAVTKWQPAVWADLFAKSGARYVVLTAKHHDGFRLWPARHPHAHQPGFEAARDIVGDLAKATRERQMRFGVYYSGGLDWSFPARPLTNVVDLFLGVPPGTNYLAQALNDWRELIDRYQPSILWNDLGSPPNLNVNALLAYYYTKFPDGVVNERFHPGLTPRDEARHFDFRTPAVAATRTNSAVKFEVVQLLGASAGHNRQETGEHMISTPELVRLLVDVVSKNGNLLVNVGPTADGMIPAPQRERLTGLGQWLEPNGEAVFGTRPWRLAEARTKEGDDLRFAEKGAVLYAFLLAGRPRDKTVTLTGWRAMDDTRIQILGTKEELNWKQTGESLVVSMPGTLPETPVLALRIHPQPILLKR
jgi:alpha-L-fucosidase